MELIYGDCLEKMKDIPSESVDSIVTDPPYELGFMGKSWDNTGIANNVEMWSECLRVLKPGGHLLAFSGTRTYHRMASAIEDAGFEVRDMIEWVYGSGFPKSLNIGKAVDKLQGNERKELGMVRRTGKESGTYGAMKGNNMETKGTSEWEGWGTALKPAHEPICMARKPLAEKTVAENVLRYGTGGINIDESRVDVADSEKVKQEGHIRKGNVVGDSRTSVAAGQFGDGAFVAGTDLTNGRFPANLIHDNSEEVRECFPETKSGRFKEAREERSGDSLNSWKNNSLGGGDAPDNYGDSGNASRFFKSIVYQAKASKSERNKGCEGLEENFTTEQNKWTENDYRKGDGEKTVSPTKNNHPTVKPIALMEYLIKMVTPKGGVVLDPFMGSGSTGVACKQLDRNFIGIEKDREYFEIAKNRIESIAVQKSLFKGS